MALTLSYDGSQYLLSGVTRDPEVLAPLGRRYFNVGAHWIGFDDRFADPVIVRAYYDPTADPNVTRVHTARPAVYIGYLQFMQLSFRAMPIPPNVYGGRLADRQPYVYGDDYRFIDFMGPSDAKLRNVQYPYYPFNALLVNGGLTQTSDFYNHPLENGSLCAPGELGTGQSLVASLVGEISPGLVTPALISPYITADNLLVVYRPSTTDLAGAEPYRLALNQLKTAALPDALGDPPPLQGLDETGVAAQAIGDYVLLTLPDDENLGDTLCISTQPAGGGGTDIYVHLLTDYDTAGMSYDAGRAALWRIREFQLDQGWVDNSMQVGGSTGRGASGLLSPPYRLSPSDYVLELRYWTLAVAQRSRALRSSPSRVFLSGVTWTALFQFDEDTGQLAFSAIGQPQPVASAKMLPGLNAYNDAVQSPRAPGQVVDVSNFTKAAMRRDNFAAGTKLRFVDASGTELS